MRILYISSEYPPETGNGGIGTYTKHAAEGMAARGHHVTVLTRSINGRELSSIKNGVSVYRVPPAPYPLPPYRVAYFFRRIMRTFFPHFLDRLSWMLAVRKKVLKVSSRQQRFDILESPECGAESLLVPRQAARKLIIRFHTPWEIIRQLDSLKEATGDQFLLPLIERLTACRASSCSSPSQAMAAEIRRRWHKKKITIIPNPLPNKHHRSANGSSWIYTGRVERRKGVHHLIEAYTIFCQTHPDAPNLFIIGRPYGTESNGKPYGALISSLIDTSPATTKITWIEGVPLDEVYAHLTNSSVAFFPSLWENYPYTCLEAMSCGLLAVATECGGFPEIITDKKTGILVRPGSTESLLLAMIWICDNKEQSLLIAQTGQTSISSLVGRETICSRMENYYHNVLKGKQ